MIVLSLIAIGFGLSMDAFAAAVGKGLSNNKWKVDYALLIAFFFGLFQAGMPVLGWLVAGQFKEEISRFDHWLAFVLLVGIGLKMIVESRKPVVIETEKKNGFGEIIILSIATSIDALAAGITFSILDYDIVLAALIIGLITFFLSFLGVWTGYRFGCRCKKIAESLGGLILIAIGLKILIEHLFF
ncbi:MAG: manganese efflux pump MntP family protein [Bacilli bacterium]|nr:manganese efflux pump MntP family protein [Bacilli bacterium]MDY0063651.1 manganese efflux pump MntP family protein [Bacilli bacterium]